MISFLAIAFVVIAVGVILFFIIHLIWAKPIKPKCSSCNEEEVEHEGDWCDDCNLPERSVIQ